MRSERLGLLLRLTLRARENRSAELARARAELAVAEEATAAAGGRVAALAARAHASRGRLDSLPSGEAVDRWAREDAWARGLARERRCLEALGETLRRCSARRESVVDAARQAVVGAHQELEGVERLAVRMEAVLRRRRARREED